MVQYPTTEIAVPGRGMAGPMMDWNNEITPERGTPRPAENGSGWQNSPAMQNGAQMGIQGRPVGRSPQTKLDMRNRVSDDVIEAPLSVAEAHLGSLKTMLQRNRGNYIVATFLIGTQSTVSFEGVLYEVGNDFVTIYQEGRDRYIVVDMYSLKYMEFYDTRDRAMCRAMLQDSGSWQML